MGVPQSDENAVKWFTKAAEKGLASAQYNLGRCYENGDGISKSYEKAVEWYSKAANQGDARAQFGLGECYYNGWGVSKSYEKAVEWYTKAANQRHLPAQYKLGVCYDNAWGVTRSKANAVEWFIKAANLKYKEAIAKVEELKKKYKPANIPTPSKKGDYSGTVKTSGGIVYADDKKNIFVYIPNTDIVTMTDDKGRFFLRGVKNVNDVQAIVARTNKGKIGRQPRLSISGNFIKP